MGKLDMRRVTFSDHRIDVGGQLGPEPPAVLEVDLPGLPDGESIIVVMLTREVRYFWDGERLLRSHEPTECWCGGRMK